LTEVLGVVQAISRCELYVRMTKSGRRSRIYLLYIAGIYDGYLKKYAEDHKVEIASDVLWQAGLGVARKAYQLLVDRKYPVTFIIGGARPAPLHRNCRRERGDHDQLGRHGGQVLAADPPVIYRMFYPLPAHVLKELQDKLSDFRRGYLNRGLVVEEYGEFGPVELFGASFVKSWKHVLEVARARWEELDGDRLRSLA
jgi:hypothetical protein